MHFNLENNFGLNPSVCDWRYKDTSWPYFDGPEILFDPKHSDVAYLIEKQIAPPPKSLLMGPYHKKEDYELGAFKFPYMKWINQKYDLQLFRLVESWTESFVFTAINLGGGYWLQAAGLNPEYETHSEARAFYLAFFWNTSESPKHDGGQRLREFLSYFSEMPDNPFEHCFLRPTGHELLERHCRHLKAIKYNEHPKHTTDRLIKFYGYWLGAKPTKFKDELGHPYYRANFFKPKSVVQYSEPWPWPKLLEDQV